MYKAFSAPFLFSSAYVFILSKFTLENDVSALEKNAEQISKKITTTESIISTFTVFEIAPKNGSGSTFKNLLKI